MKKIIHISFFVFISLLFWSCNNDFLDENKREVVEIIAEPYKIYNSDSQFQKMTVDIPQAQDKSYTIRQYPYWMKFTAMESKFHGGVAELEFSLDLKDDYTGMQRSGIIVLDIEKIGYVELHVYYINEGHPVIIVFPDDIYFEKDVSISSFEILNTGDGYLNWKIVSKPDWITFQNIGELEGRVQRYSSKILYIKCNRGNLTPGDYKGEIVIESNSKKISQSDGKAINKVQVLMKVM